MDRVEWAKYQPERKECKSLGLQRKKKNDTKKNRGGAISYVVCRICVRVGGGLCVVLCTFVP